MSVSDPGDLSASEIIGRIENGSLPPQFISAVARGFLALPQDDLIAVLAFLSLHEDEETASSAKTSLGELPPRALFSFAGNDRVDAEHLGYLARATHDSEVLEALVRNRATADETVIALAQSAPPELQEVIAINQARILRRPEILEALLANPGLTNDVHRRVLETREEFFDKRARVEEAAAAAAAVLAEQEPAVEAEASLAEIADLLEKAAAEGGEAQQTIPELAPVEKDDPEKVSVFTKILKLTVAEKVQLGFKGAKTERSILVRDRNRLVCAAVMRNPRITDSEVESIAAMRNVDDEALRLITMKREWMAKYPIVLALARNPKCPIGVVLPLINRLTLRDLKNLASDKNVGEVVRTLARKLFQQRSAKNG
jgi:hypothetical protein